MIVYFMSERKCSEVIQNVLYHDLWDLVTVSVIEKRVIHAKENNLGIRVHLDDRKRMVNGYVN